MHQLGDFRVVQVGGRAATPVHLGDRALLAHQLGLLLDFALQAIEVLPRHAFFPGDDLVAGAVVADVPAEGQVQVQGQRCALVVPIPVLPGEVLFYREILAELGRGRVGGITRAVAGIPGGQLHVRQVFGRYARGGGIRQYTRHSCYRLCYHSAHRSKTWPRER